MLDERLLQLLVCPEDKQSLEYLSDENVLYNPRLHRVYDVRDDIPVLLIDDSRSVDDTEHTRLSKLIDSGAAVRTAAKES